MLLLLCFYNQESMDNEVGVPTPELVEDLCHLYVEQERSRALNLDVCDSILSSDNRGRREWVQLGDVVSDKPAK
jgi:hypothetical protein